MATTVILIIDEEFGGRLEPREDAAIWLIDSATNLDALERLRRTSPEIDVTTFRDQASSAADVFAARMADIDLHHGAFSQEQPFTQLVVYGARANERVRSALAEHGFALEAHTGDGFTAFRVAAA